MNKQEILTPEKFAEIYTNESFRNGVAYAVCCSDKNGNITHKRTVTYPIEYIVSDEQIATANKEIKRAKLKTIKDNEGKLLFTGMGMDYPARYEDDVCNHRVRTDFVNRYGKRFFIEFGTGRGDSIRIDHSIDRDLQDYEDNAGISGQSYNNYAGLEHKNDLGQYTLTNLLNIVNTYFECDFKEIVIDNYNISPDDNISVSPIK